MSQKIGKNTIGFTIKKNTTPCHKERVKKWLGTSEVLINTQAFNNGNIELKNETIGFRWFSDSSDNGYKM